MNWLKKNSTIVTMIGFIIFMTIVLFCYQYYDPTYSDIAPKCVIKNLTGYNCPACGCQRLLYQWAHGNFIEGLRYNYFFAIGLIYLILICIGFISPFIHRVVVSKWAINSFIILYFVWWILRNLLGI